MDRDMRPNSEINEVHTAPLGKKYGRVARHLRKWDRKGVGVGLSKFYFVRRSWWL